MCLLKTTQEPVVLSGLLIALLFKLFFMILFIVFREENNCRTDLTISVGDHICHTIGTHLGNIFYGREQIVIKQNMDMGTINLNSLFECTVPVGIRTPHGPM